MVRQSAQSHPATLEIRDAHLRATSPAQSTSIRQSTTTPGDRTHRDKIKPKQCVADRARRKSRSRVEWDLIFRSAAVRSQPAVLFQDRHLLPANLPRLSRRSASARFEKTMLDRAAARRQPSIAPLRVTSLEKLPVRGPGRPASENRNDKVGEDFVGNRTRELLSPKPVTSLQREDKDVDMR